MNQGDLIKMIFPIGRLPKCDMNIAQVVESGVNNVLFIRTTVADPLSLVTRILEGIRDNRKQVTRHLIRMLPVQATCKAYEENVKPTLQTLVDNFVAGRTEGDTFTKYQVRVIPE